MNFIPMRPLTAPPCRNLEENSNCSAAGVDITVAFQHGDVADLRNDNKVAHGEVETAANATAVSEHTRKELAATTSSGSSKSLADHPRKKKRVCKISGCSRSVKAQGHCQKHGAKIKRCKAPGCNSQAQGSHEGYCKRHWQERLDPEDPRKKTKKKKEEEQTACEPFGSSVYDYIVPASFAWKTEMSGRVKSPIKEDALEGGGGQIRRISTSNSFPYSSISLKTNHLTLDGTARTNASLVESTLPNRYQLSSNPGKNN